MLTPPPPPPPPGDRDKRGRFRRGHKEGGRPVGARNAATLAVETLMAGEAETITRRAIELAKLGDTTALRLVLERIAPVRRGRPVVISNFPDVQSLADVPKAHAALLAAVANGELTSEEAGPLAAMLNAFTGSLDAAALAARLDDLEKRLAES